MSKETEGKSKAEMDFQKMTVLVAGLARSGVAAARLCTQKGATVLVHDMKKRDALKEDTLSPLEGLEIRYLLGEAPREEILRQLDCMVLSPGIPTDLPYIQRARELGVPVWSEVELGYRFCASPIIGITGTNGKTTTTALTGQILKAWKPGSQVAGNIGIAFTEIVETTGPDDVVVMELSSFQLEIIDQFHPHISAILNITPDHLNRHKTLEAYIAAKQNIVRNQGADDFCILNWDDPCLVHMGEEIRAKAGGPRVIYFSRKTPIPGGVYVRGDEFISAIDGDAIPICRVEEMKIFGVHNEENALAAIACSLCAGVPAAVIRQELMRFPGVEHRIEFVGCIDGVSYYNDSKATNPDAAIKGLCAMKTPTVLIGGGMDKAISFDPWTALFPGRVKKLILLGETKDMIFQSAVRAGYPADDILRVNTLEEAVHSAADLAETGDSVLLSPACASWDMFESYEQRGDLFREIVTCLDKANH